MSNESPAGSLREKIEKDREEHRKDRVKMTMIEFLEAFRKDSKRFKEMQSFAHARVYRAIKEKGVVPVQKTSPAAARIFQGKEVAVYPLFSEHLFGVEEAVDEVVRYFRAASHGGAERKQMLLLLGPPGGGKSSLLRTLQRAIEHSGPFFGLEGCPMHEDPLRLVPRHLRQEFSKMLGVTIDPDADICPICRGRLKRAANDDNGLDGKWENFPIAQYNFSLRNRLGIDRVPPSDPNNQDISILIGAIDIGKTGLKDRDDPRMLSLDGAFARGEGGVVEMVEIWKNDPKFLQTLLTATADGFIPAPAPFGNVSCNVAIIGHTNMAEWRKFLGHDENEGYFDRTVVVRFPYNLRHSEEVRAYQESLKSSDLGLKCEPHTLETLAAFAIMSRLLPPKKGSLGAKMAVYDGQDYVGDAKEEKVEYDEYRKDDNVKNEGMTGVSFRFSMERVFHKAIVEGEFVDPMSIAGAIEHEVKLNDKLEEKERKRFLEILNTDVRKFYHDRLDKDLTSAMSYAFEDQAQSLYQKYLDNAQAFITKKKVRQESTKEELEPDLKFLAAVEEKIGVSGTAAEGFRSNVFASIFDAQRRGEKLDYRSYGPLRKAIEEYLKEIVRPMLRILTKRGVRDKEQEQKHTALTKRLHEMGYHRVDRLLDYAGNNLYKD